MSLNKSAKLIPEPSKENAAKKVTKGTESHIYSLFLRKSLVKFISDFCIKLVSLHYQTSYCMVNIEQLFGEVHVSAKALFKNSLAGWLFFAFKTYGLIFGTQIKCY